VLKVETVVVTGVKARTLIGSAHCDEADERVSID
jgi:hypothetical protein